MIDAMLVLDRQNRVMDLNLAARKLSGVSLFSALGKDFYEVLPDLRGIAPDSDISAQLTGEVTLTLAGALHYYELQINSLTDTDSKVIGRLVALHDITQRKQEQVQLQKAYAELEDRIQDRTSDLQKANLQLRKSRDHLRALTSALQDAEAIERRKIAAELHDRVGQNLTALNLNLKRMVNKLPAEEHSHAQSILTDSAALLEETTRQVRNVMADLNPPMLEEYGLIPALTWHGDKFCERTGITVKVTGDQPAKRLPERIEMALFRIAQECLNNVAKHSQASTVMIALRITREEIILLLEDNGVGFDSDQTGQPGQQPHWGLITMRERAQSIGGDLSIQASPGEGTRLQVSLRRDSDDN
jgi:PAS domain S-box-containing protein